MKRALLVSVIASFFSSVAFADFTIASSKKLDARVDVVGAKDDKWCESNLSLKFLTTSGKDLSQTAYDELHPKVQSLISSQCAKASNVTFVRGSEKTSYLVKAGDWIADYPKVTEAVTPKVEDKPEVKSEPKSETKAYDKNSKKETKDSPISKETIQLHLTKLSESLKAKDTSYFKSMTNKDFFVRNVNGFNGGLKRDEYIVYLNDILNKKFNKIENVSFVIDENVDFWNNKHKVTIEGVANENGGLAKYRLNLTFSMFKNGEDGSYFIDRLEQKIEVGDQVDSSGNKVVNAYWDYKEFLALTAKKPNEIETYIGNYIVLKNNKSCMAFNQASEDLKKFNDFIASYEKEALDYKKMVESTKEAKSKYKDTLSLGEYDEKLEGYKINSIGMVSLNQNATCYANKLEQPLVNVLVANNVQFLKIPLRLANSIKGEKVTIELTFEPRLTEYKGKPLHIISSKHTKIVHEKSGTVLFDDDIPKSVYKSAADDYLEKLEKAKKEREANKKKMSASECEQIRWLGGKCD